MACEECLLYNPEQLKAEVERLKGERDDAITKLSQVDEVLIVNHLGPRADGDYQKALSDLVALSIEEHDNPAISPIAAERKNQIAAKDTEIETLAWALESLHDEGTAYEGPCGCGHPACKKCRWEREFEAAQTRAKEALSSPASQRALERIKATQAVVEAARVLKLQWDERKCYGQGMEARIQVVIDVPKLRDLAVKVAALDVLEEET